MLIVISCSSKVTKNSNELNEIDASNYFFKNYPKKLNNLKEYEDCILRESIKKDLIRIVVDSFEYKEKLYIKKYNVSYLAFSFFLPRTCKVIVFILLHFRIFIQCFTIAVITITQKMRSFMLMIHVA